MGRWGSFGTCCRIPWWMGCMKVLQYRKPNWKSVFWGAFHSTQNSGNFGWFIKWNGPFRFGPTGIFGTSFEGGPQWPVWSFQSVEPKCPFPFAKIVIPSTALLYPAFKNNNQTRGGLGRVCATEMHHSIPHVKFPKFRTAVSVEWKANKPTNISKFQFD